jgi:hypothetical protein
MMSVAGNEQNQPHSVMRRVLTGRQLVTCAQCGWVHYAMTAEEKSAADAEASMLAERYRMSEAELTLLELSLRQCLRCESPATSFRVAAPQDVARAQGHIVTPVYVEPEAGALRG